MTEQDESPQIHVDSDWKTQARAEKEKLAQQSQADQEHGGGPAGPGGLPPATFETLVSTMVTQALFAMGAIPDPRTGERIQHLDLARHHIDMLTVLEEKTKGNLNEDETKLITTAVYELRSRYIQSSTAGAHPG